ncbi:DMP19 family protein [Jannaschia formosa]|uniref:DMP19 family protein n=1 Tax=Jannaschia formosa TaxID=2259592 RepID=UPI001074FE66|nr:hypothetical protein [Jannaschia formosa]TFL18853.1 hypothetical protein DR046_08000 [Jannaschia formosa]
MESFVGHLLSRGAAPARIPSDYRGAAAVERYVGNVEGEGHALFAENAGSEIRAILEDASTGSEVLNLPAVGSIIAEYRDLLEEDPRWEGGTLEDEGKAKVFRERYEALDERLYAVKAGEAEIMQSVEDIPQEFRAEVRTLLETDSFYRANLPYLRGRVWVLNHPRLEWHVGPNYWDRVTALARDLQ